MREEIEGVGEGGQKEKKQVNVEKEVGESISRKGQKITKYNLK